MIKPRKVSGVELRGEKTWRVRWTSEEGEERSFSARQKEHVEVFRVGLLALQGGGHGAEDLLPDFGALDTPEGWATAAAAVARGIQVSANARDLGAVRMLRTASLAVKDTSQGWESASHEVEVKAEFAKLLDWCHDVATGKLRRTEWETMPDAVKERILQPPPDEDDICLTPWKTLNGRRGPGDPREG